jgi:hypothetical protein
MLVMGAEAEKQARVAQTGRGNFHLHLGFTMPHTKFTIVDMGPLVTAVGKRAAPWQGRLMSSLARLILIDVYLSSLLLYNMGLFMFPDEVHTGFDKHQSKFF